MNDKSKRYSEGEPGQRSGLTARALRPYEKLGLLRSFAGGEAGYRLYCQADVLRLHRLLGCGFLSMLGDQFTFLPMPWRVLH